MTSVLNKLIDGSIKGIGGMIGKQVFSSLLQAIFGQTDDLSEIKDQLSSVLDKLEEIQKGQQVILEKIDSIRAQIEKRIVSENLKDSFASILSLTTQLHSLLKVIKDGGYDGKKKLLQDNYKVLAASVQGEISQAVSRMALSDIELLKLEHENAFKNNTDVFNYHISLCFVIEKFVFMYKKAIDLFEFALKDFPILSGSIDIGNKRLEELEKWKNSHVISSVTPLVCALLDESKTVYRAKPCRYYGLVNKYPDAMLSVDDIPYGIRYAVVTIIRRPPVSVTFRRAEGFSLENPIIKFDCGNGSNVSVGQDGISVPVKRGKFLNASGYVSLPSDWLLQFRETSAIPSEEQSGYFCFYNVHYQTCAINVDYVEAVEFSASEKGFFWKLDD